MRKGDLVVVLPRNMGLRALGQVVEYRPDTLGGSAMESWIVLHNGMMLLVHDEVMKKRRYKIPKAAHVFVGHGLEFTERIAFFIGKDGGGIGFIDSDPVGYIEMSKHMAAATEYKKVHGVWPASPGKLAAGPEEYEFDEDTFNYNAEEIIQEASMSLF